MCIYTPQELFDAKAFLTIVMKTWGPNEPCRIQINGLDKVNQCMGPTAPNGAQRTLVNPLGLTWPHLDALALNWIHLDSRLLTWTQLDSLGLPRVDLDSLGLTWTHVGPLGLTWTHLDCLGFS